ncbi:MAG: class I SAM-dependent methyltransferase [Thermoleophilia bacterium]
MSDALQRLALLPDQVMPSDQELTDLVRARLAERSGRGERARIRVIEPEGGLLARHLTALAPEHDVVAGDGPADVVIANGVLHHLPGGEFADAVRELTAAIAPGGMLVLFDYFHVHDQELETVERTPAHPDGLRHVVRGYRATRDLLQGLGMRWVEFHPFRQPFDLPASDDPDHLRTHTVMTEDSGRLCLRGSLLQPWCHVVAHRSPG